MKKRDLWRTISYILITLLLIFAMVACDIGQSDSGSNEEKSTTAEGLKVGLSLGSALEERFERHKKAFIEHATELGVDLVIQEAQSDSALQLTQIEGKISDKVDVLIVLAADSNASSTIGEMAKQAKIPLISYNTFVMDTDAVEYYIGYSDVHSGELIAETVINNGETKGNVAILRGDATNGVQQDMSKGFDAYMKEYFDSGQVTAISDTFIKNWAADASLDEAENVLTERKNDVAAFAVWNDTMAGGVIEALAEQGLAGKVIVTGQDMDISACQRIAEGTQTMTIYKPDKEICYLTLDVAVAVAKGEDPTETVDYQSVASLDSYNNGVLDVPIMMVNTESVTKENLADYMINTKYYDLDKVYENVPEDQWPQLVKDAIGN